MGHVDFYNGEHIKMDNFSKVELRRNDIGGIGTFVNGVMLPDVLNYKIVPTHPFPRLIVEIAIEELDFDSNVSPNGLRNSTTAKLGEKMKARDIRLIKTCDAFPEQYDAVNGQGDIIGYIRVRGGYITVLCPGAESDTEVYNKNLRKGYGLFSSPMERKRELKKARKAIASWWNGRALSSQ